MKMVLFYAHQDVDVVAPSISLNVLNAHFVYDQLGLLIFFAVFVCLNIDIERFTNTRKQRM